MSPEQVLGKQLDARSDVSRRRRHSLSAAHRTPALRSGQRIRDRQRSPQIFATRPHRHQPKHPRTSLSKIVLKALAKPPDDRFQTAKEFLDSISLLHTGERPQPSPLQPCPRNAEAALASNNAPIKQAIDPNVLDSVSRELAFHVGPIAKVIASRAAKRAISLDELYKLLATEISTEKSRQDFLATRNKYSTPR